MSRRWCPTIAAIGIVLGICRIASANSFSPYVYFWPGIISISIIYAFPASLLAALVERPFLSAAGIKRRPLVFSLRANFLSTIAGILLIPIGYRALYTIGPLWCVAAFGMSCAVEIVYLRRFSRQSFQALWAVAGNAVSSALLMVLPPLAIALRTNNQELAWSLEPYEMRLAWSSLGVSVIVFLASFAWPIGSITVIAAADSVGTASTPSKVDAEETLLGRETETVV